MLSKRAVGKHGRCALGLAWIVLSFSLPKVVFPQDLENKNVANEGKTTAVTLNQKADGYRGIWYMNQPSNDEYVYKYSGGLGTYCAKHHPFAIYCKEVNKTFFCYGGGKPDDDRALLHMVSYFDHETKTVPQPTILLDKKTNDAHDWMSHDQGMTWQKKRQLTSGSEKNHTYVRQVQNAHPDFVVIWADGHGRKPSKSSLYLADAQGNVFRFPGNMGTSKSTPMEKVTR